jgi:hypothetical protein
MQLKVNYEPQTGRLAIDGPTDPVVFFGLLGMAMAMKVTEQVMAQVAAAEQLASNPPGLQLVQGAAAAEIARAAKRGL